jgi:hypothetical protein
MPFYGEMRTVAETPAWDLQNNMISKDSGPFWCFRVIFAHQFGVNDDADPFSEVASTTGAPSPTRGVCVKVWPILSNPNHAFGYAYVFIEAIRDYAFTGSALTSYTTDKDATRARLWREIYGAVAHEIGHSPGRQHPDNDHSEPGLMSGGGGQVMGTRPDQLPPLLYEDPISAKGFSPVTIRRFRTAKSWSD